MARERCRDGFFSPSIVATSILVLGGLRGTAAEVNYSWKHSETFPERRNDLDHVPGDGAALDAQSSGGTPIPGAGPHCAVRKQSKAKPVRIVRLRCSVQSSRAYAARLQASRGQCGL